MSDIGKTQQKLQKQMGIIQRRNHTGCCWVCGSQSGVKAGREAYKPRCNRCENLGETTDDVVKYEQLKTKLNSFGGKNV